ncbi:MULTISPECIES: leader peptide processing enzyme [unclassified Oceanispirochaeta]|uniref:leader peptide processing enzyme n=1 Tax=unclassified Oceanispirochaeta TaxID=2635722 RepID=UPI000E0949D5|nr:MULTISPECIES: leader peptide processing enzyme [unclassified Oceanispirochaeta]MBF9015393.1 leader peptide processing enzyme [Oceanispirochaeta sp. M2]NPD71852.1 leader peptide processing enzyme [Oceanispirochaeta sp. M1]RDG32661.1 leader peptide processing enzyme [Oceanispirochaeta sp. M1]
MNKKLNTILFMLGGTVLNVVLMLGLFVLFLFLGNKVLTPETGSNVKMLIFLLIIGFSVVGSFFLYSKIIKAITKKWNLEDYMHPIFSSKKRR